MSNRFTRQAAAASFLLVMSGCGLLRQEGGYAQPCAPRERWETTVGHLRFWVFTQHLDELDEPNHIRIGVGFSTYPWGQDRQPMVLLDHRTVTLEAKGEEFRPDDMVREGRNEKTWRCSGRHPDPANLTSCGTAVLKFRGVGPEEGFLLRLGAIKVDGISYDLPPVKYCYVPRSTYLNPRLIG